LGWQKGFAGFKNSGSIKVGSQLKSRGLCKWLWLSSHGGKSAVDENQLGLSTRVTTRPGSDL